MKIRNSFVSNSSSVAFIFAFNGETREDLANQLSPDMFTEYGESVINEIKKNPDIGELWDSFDFVFNNLNFRDYVSKLMEFLKYRKKGVNSIFEIRLGDNEGDIYGEGPGFAARNGELQLVTHETPELICWVEM